MMIEGDPAIGQFARVRVTGAMEYDLMGTAV